MLQVTESAATTLADTRSQIGIPDHFGLRVFRGVSDGKAAFAFDFVEEPEDGDEVGEVEQTRYFVAPEVAAPRAIGAVLTSVRRRRCESRCSVTRRCSYASQNIDDTWRIAFDHRAGAVHHPIRNGDEVRLEAVRCPTCSCTTSSGRRRVLSSRRVRGRSPAPASADRNATRRLTRRS
jgi:Fe-S cluster assembly iron-binding protein IscA